LGIDMILPNFFIQEFTTRRRKMGEMGKIRAKV
jgi:hypothetical protein